LGADLAAIDLARFCASSGRDQLLAIVVPVDEIEKPISAIRNQTLLYSTAFLIFALPLYVTLVVAWIDRRLEGRIRWPQTKDEN
jgi:hypothetical protein